MIYLEKNLFIWKSWISLKLPPIQDINKYDLWKPTEKCLEWFICTPIFWLLYMVLFNLCFDSLLNIRLYRNNIKKSYREKR